MGKESLNNLKLGVFVIAGIILFIITIYFIGLNRNLFGSNFVLRSEFKNVSGLKQGTAVRLSGIDVGTVSKIDFISDSLVMVNLLIRKDVQQYIKKDAIASIASDGLVGDKVFVISPGASSAKTVKDNDIIASLKTVEIEDILSSVKQSADNTKIITNELVQFSHKMNDKNGLLTKILNDKYFASRIDKTITNLQRSSDDLAQFMPMLKNKNGIVAKLLTNEKWAEDVEASISNLNSSTQEISRFTARLNDKDNLLSKILSNDSLAISLDRTLKNIETSSNELVKFTSKINNKDNVLSKLSNDPKLGRSVDSIAINVEKGVSELREIENAAKHNFLLRGYFNKKKKRDERKNND